MANYGDSDSSEMNYDFLDEMWKVHDQGSTSAVDSSLLNDHAASNVNLQNYGNNFATTPAFEDSNSIDYIQPTLHLSENAPVAPTCQNQFQIPLSNDAAPVSQQELPEDDTESATTNEVPSHCNTEANLQSVNATAQASQLSQSLNSYPSDSFLGGAGGLTTLISGLQNHTQAPIVQVINLPENANIIIVSNHPTSEIAETTTVPEQGSALQVQSSVTGVSSNVEDGGTSSFVPPPATAITPVQRSKNLQKLGELLQVDNKKIKRQKKTPKKNTKAAIRQQKVRDKDDLKKEQVKLAFRAAEQEFAQQAEENRTLKVENEHLKNQLGQY